jgi:hypothetical protein
MAKASKKVGTGEFQTYTRRKKRTKSRRTRPDGYQRRKPRK